MDASEEVTQYTSSCFQLYEAHFEFGVVLFVRVQLSLPLLDVGSGFLKSRREAGVVVFQR